MGREERRKRLVITAHHEAAHVVVLYRTAGFAGGPVTIAPDRDKGYLGSALNVLGDRRSADAHADRRFGFYLEWMYEQDEAVAAEHLRWFAWEDREIELREESRILVERHWAEIVAVAEELLHVTTLDETEAEIIADIVVGAATLADLAHYRAFRRHVQER